jgi:hypothetical protein
MMTDLAGMYRNPAFCFAALNLICHIELTFCNGFHIIEKVFERIFSVPPARAGNRESGAMPERSGHCEQRVRYSVHCIPVNGI